jgi:hypothetical protein
LSFIVHRVDGLLDRVSAVPDSAELTVHRSSQY